MNKISVIVPIYKVENYLDRCLDSLVNQTYKNLEIILVDDGSPDKCPQMCDEWVKKDKRIKVIHKENGGVSSARNSGLEKATGDYIAFVDADDFIEKTMYEKLINSVTQEKSDIALCRFSYFYEKNKKEVFVFEKNLNGLNGDNIYQYLLKNEKKKKKNIISTENIMGSVCRGIYSKELLYDIIFEKIIIAEDFVFLIDMFNKHPKVSIVNEYLYKYVQREASAMHGLSKRKVEDQLKSHILVCERLNNKMDERLLSANKFHVYTKIMINIANENKIKQIKSFIEKKYEEIFNTKYNFRNAMGSTKSIKLKIAYWLIYHKQYWFFAFASKLLRRK